MNSKYQLHYNSHLVSCFEEFNSNWVRVKEMDESFRVLKQFEVVFTGVHEKFINMHIYHLDVGQYFKGSMENFVDKNKEFSSDEYSDFLRRAI